MPYCNMCVKSTQAPEVREFCVDGAKYSTQLCVAHAREHDSDMRKWTWAAQELGPHRGQSSAKVLIPPRPAQQVEPREAERHRPALTTPRFTASKGHKLTAHARERILERNLDAHDVVLAAEVPEVSYPSVRSDRCVKQIYKKVAVIVDVENLKILTAYRDGVDDDEQEMSDVLSRQETGV